METKVLTPQEVVKKEMAERKLTEEKFAREIGLNQATLVKIVEGSKRLKLLTLSDAMSKLGYELRISAVKVN